MENEEGKTNLMLKRLLGYLKPFLWGMALAILAKAAATLTDLMIPRFMGMVIDDGIAKGDAPTILRLCLGMLGLTIATSLFTVISNYFASKKTQQIGERLRNILYTHIQKLTITDVEHISTASLITRVTNDVEHVQRTFLMMTRFIIRAPIMAIGGVIFALAVDVKLTCIIFVAMALLASVSFTVFGIVRPIYRKLQKSIDRMTSIIRENLAGVKVIKSFSKADYEIRRVREQSEKVRHYELKAGRIQALIGPSITLISNITIAVVMYVSGFRIQDGGIELGQVVAIVNYITMILQAMVLLPRMFMLFSRANISAGRLLEVLDIKDFTEYGKLTREEASENTEAPVLEFRNVTFHYPDSNLASLKNISFTAGKCQTVAVIGGTGSGKTTLLNLLLRLYEPTEGGIYLYGQPVSAYSKESYTQAVTAAMQQYNIFGMSIRDNIVLDRQFDKDRLYQSAKSAQLLEFVEELEDSFDHQVSQTGTNLSGGQKQRISVARTLYREPDVVVLDDVSSALDYRTDYQLRSALRENYRDKTVLLISQRISSVKSADKILVLEKGRMVGFGSHQELIETCETYRDICRTQDVPVPEYANSRKGGDEQ